MSEKSSSEIENVDKRDKNRIPKYPAFSTSINVAGFEAVGC